MLNAAEQAAIIMILNEIDQSYNVWIAKCVTDTPASHVIRFGHRINFDTNFLSTRCFEEADGLLAIKSNCPIGEVTDHSNVVLIREPNRILIEGRGCSGTCWVIRVINKH